VFTGKYSVPCYLYLFKDMDGYQQLLYDIEVHSTEGIKRYFNNGGSPNEVHNGVPLFTTMVEMYLRSSRFKECIRVFIEFGLNFTDKALLAVLSDDSEKLQEEIKADGNIANKRYSVFNNTFTPLTGATLLHYCAEYNHVKCAKVLMQGGADANAEANLDENGFGGHTPIFHAVCQHNNNSVEVLHFLIEHSADVLITVKGLIWGKGYEWETFVPAVNPISYTMMGLLPQIHRDQAMIAGNISLLLKYAYGIEYVLPNIPNAYLNQ